MSSPIVLSTEARSGTGSRPSRQARASGRVPVNLYGHGEANAVLTVSAHELDRAFQTAAQVFMLDISGKQQPCLVKEVQFDTFGQEVLHVDFSRIDLSEEVAVEINLEFRGTSKGSQAGGTQIIHHPALAVRCRADSIPDVLIIDVAEIEIGQGITAGEVDLPAGVRLDASVISPDEQVVGVSAPRVEEEAPTEDAEDAEGEGAEGEGEAKAEDKADGKDGAKDGDKAKS